MRVPGMSDWIEVEGKKYYEESYLLLANKTADRLQFEVAKLHATIALIGKAVEMPEGGDVVMYAALRTSEASVCWRHLDQCRKIIGGNVVSVPDEVAALVADRDRLDKLERWFKAQARDDERTLAFALDEFWLDTETLASDVTGRTLRECLDAVEEPKCQSA